MSRTFTIPDGEMFIVEKDGSLTPMTCGPVTLTLQRPDECAQEGCSARRFDDSDYCGQHDGTEQPVPIVDLAKERSWRGSYTFEVEVVADTLTTTPYGDGSDDAD